MYDRLPIWLKKKVPHLSACIEMEALLKSLSLHTVCQSAHCPNQGDCFLEKNATFLIMGEVCTRNCRFCAVRKGKPSPLDPEEPRSVALAIKRLGLKHVVITSVTRDDLRDGGASHFVETIYAIRQINAETTVEVLIPDFSGSLRALKTVIDSCPEVLSHNIETVPRLYAGVRPKALYQRSLDLLRTVKATNTNIVTKSGLMLGLGEERDEVISVMKDLCTAKCDCLTIGQYLAPSTEHHPVASYIPPQEFEQYQSIAEKMSFYSVVSGPFVRSSYNAGRIYRRIHAQLRSVRKS